MFVDEVQLVLLKGWQAQCAAAKPCCWVTRLASSSQHLRHPHAYFRSACCNTHTRFG